MTTQQTLSLNDLGKGAPALTPDLGKVYAESGAVCLDNQGHQQGTTLKVEGSHTNNFTINWPQVTDQMKLTYGDLEVATENGAYGIAILLAQNLLNHTVIERSRKGTGFDYWLGEENSDSLFQNKARLEVSGILNGTDCQIKHRAKQKLKQTEPSDPSGLAAYIAIIEFSRPLSKFQKK